MYYTIPNLLTIFRFILIPVFLNAFFSPSPIVQLLALPVFILAAVTDYLDGYLARKLGKTTYIGQFMDPLADKLLTMSLLMAFLNRVEFSRGNAVVVFMFWSILAIEVVVTVFSIHAFYTNRTLNTTRTGKLKTVLQFFLLLMILIRHSALIMKENAMIRTDFWQGRPMETAVLVLIGITFLLTLISASINLKVNVIDENARQTGVENDQDP